LAEQQAEEQEREEEDEWKDGDGEYWTRLTLLLEEASDVPSTTEMPTFPPCPTYAGLFIQQEFPLVSQEQTVLVAGDVPPPQLETSSGTSGGLPNSSFGANGTLATPESTPLIDPAAAAGLLPLVFMVIFLRRTHTPPSPEATRIYFKECIQVVFAILALSELIEVIRIVAAFWYDFLVFPIYAWAVLPVCEFARDHIVWFSLIYLLVTVNLQHWYKFARVKMSNREGVRKGSVKFSAQTETKPNAEKWPGRESKMRGGFEGLLEKVTRFFIS